MDIMDDIFNKEKVDVVIYFVGYKVVGEFV